MDIMGAFTRVDRHTIIAAVRKHAPELAPLAVQWLSEPVEHTISGGTVSGQPAKQSRGFDQGCPLSPAFFAIAMRDAFEAAERDMQAKGPKARLVAYLDDTFLLAELEALVMGRATFQCQLHLMGFQIHPIKDQVHIPEVVASDKEGNKMINTKTDANTGVTTAPQGNSYQNHSSLS